MTTGTVKSNINPSLGYSTLVKGIGTLYIENPNNVADISIDQFEWHQTKRNINQTYEQGYVYFVPGALRIITNNYLQNMDIYTNFHFSNN